MFAIIVSPARAAQIREVVEPLGGVSFESAEILDSDGTKKVFQSAARVSADVLILDLDAAPGSDLVAAARHYRIARPDTRVILLAVGREPGDPTVAQLVALGIYDIVAGGAEENLAPLVREVIQKPPASFAQAARWYVQPEEKNVEQKQKERLVIERRPLGMVTVAVASAASGIGATHTALMIASFLAQRKNTVALLEACTRPRLLVACGILEATEGKLEKSWRFGNLDIFPLTTDPDVVPDVLEVQKTYEERLQQIRNRYEYVVIDIGEPAFSGAWTELSRASLAVLVASAAPWRWTDLRPFIQKFSDFELVLAAPSEGMLKMFRRDTGLEALSIPYSPDPFNLPKEAEEVMEKLLTPLLPERKPKSGGFGLFKLLRK
jgi:DNA-binding NarL/FixJ family response regulator